MKTLPFLGFGLGLRAKHYPYIFEHRPSVDWFEIISENFMDTHGKPRRSLEKIRQDYPVVMHGVSLSIGTVDPLNSPYLKQLKDLIQWLEPAWISDHLCWTGVAHKNTHDLLPVPYTEEALHHIVDRIKRVQDFLGRPVAFENPSTYLEFQTSHMQEEEFLARMVEASDALLLLDVNNVYVSCYNHGWDPKTYLDALPLDRVIQIHLSGHTNKGTHIIDTHDAHVTDEVFSLYQYVISKAGRTPNTMVEWDDQIPEFPVLYAELEKARILSNTPTQGFFFDMPFKDTCPFMCEDISLDAAERRMQEAILLGHAGYTHPESWIVPKSDFSSQAQLDVYINAYRWRLQGVVADDYEVLSQYLGPKAFHVLVRDFVESIPSTHFNIGRYAVSFSAFVKDALPEDLFAHELCLLETAISQLADLPETAPLTPQDVASITPENFLSATLYPRATLQLFHFKTNVNDYYQAVLTNEVLPTPTAADTYYAVYRHEDEMWRLRLGKEEHTFLQALFEGVSISTALDTLPPELPQDALGAWFARWLSNGLLSNKIEYFKRLNKGAA
ncbi:MAG: DUF692 family protein [Alphaproteobacteria bacterium]|nr:DUF692 family protein [Alphaproteobacteria bacterium]